MELYNDNLRAVVFDLDGTLYDNKGLPLKLVLADIWNMWVLGAERKARKQIKGIDYKDAADVYDALFQRMTEVKKNLTIEKARSWYQEKYMPLQVALLGMYFVHRPLCVELLEAMKDKGLKLVLYSDYGHATEKIEALGISPELFDNIVSAAKMGGLKPCRESMQRLMEACGLEAATTLYVGDREDTDGECARSVGMPFFNVKADKDAWDRLLKSYI